MWLMFNAFAIVLLQQLQNFIDFFGDCIFDIEISPVTLEHLLAAEEADQVVMISTSYPRH